MPSTYLKVPFREKDEAKALGARWDPDRRSWYVPDGIALDDFARWLPADGDSDEALVRSANPPPRQRSAGRPSAGLGTDPATRLTADPAPELRDIFALPADGALIARDPAGQAERGAGETTALTTGGKAGIPLSRLLTAVGRVIAGSFADPLWVTVEVSHARLAPQGHVYLELSERNAAGQLIAKASGMIWASTARSILPAFEKATQVTLAAGIKLLVRVRPGFKSQYGFSLEIDAIDPAYTLGDLEAKKTEIRERLKREGLFDRNRRLPPPWDYNIIIVIAPDGAAGLGDFREEAGRLERHGLCRFFYSHSRFQGEGAAAGIQTVAAEALVSRAGVDALVIIRGGGAVNDLAWLNDYALARFVCECPVPVLTGIGHERDSTLLDEVANRSFDTPSKTILGIEQRIASRANEAREAMAQIAGLAHDAVITARHDTERLASRSREAAAASVHVARQRCERLLAETRRQAEQQHLRATAATRSALDSVAYSARQAIHDGRQALPGLRREVLISTRNAVRDSRQDLDRTIRSVGQDARQQLSRTRQQAEALVREVTGQGPAKTLGRGFALVRSADGQPLTRAQGSADAGTVQIQFQDGRLDADIRPGSLTPNDAKGPGVDLPDSPHAVPGNDPQDKPRNGPRKRAKTSKNTP